MPTKRTYPDACGLAQALNVIGERWALLIVRELLLGPKRFVDLHQDMPGISKAVLSQRLDELEGRAVLRRRRLAPPASVRVYELTEWGVELEPIVRTLGHWGARSPFFDADQPLSCTSAAISMRAMFDTEATHDAGEQRELTIDLELGQERLRAVIRSGEFDIQRAPADTKTTPPANVTVTTTPNELAKLLYTNRTVDYALAGGTLTLSGDRAAFELFTACFRLPASTEPLTM